MAELDPTVTEQFGWLNGLTIAELTGDPDLMGRFQDSYNTDSSYEPPAVPFRDVSITTALGGEVRARIYTPSLEAETSAAYVWAHGGGFIAGTIDDREADGVSREIAHRAGVVVISVDYTLANGSSVTYPRLHSEVGAALDWVRAHAAELHVDPERISIGGASAGANLAMAATLQAHHDGRASPAALILIYPLLHQLTPAPAADGADLSVLPQVLRIHQPFVDHMFASYLGEMTGTSIYASVEGQPLGQLPPTLVVVSEYDDLRPSGDQFARDAAEAGVNVTTYLAAGAIHGHLSFTATAAETNRTLNVTADFLRNT